MGLIFKRWRIATWPLISMVTFATARAELNLHSLQNASLARDHSPIVVFDITQFGMPGDEKFVFCDVRDCQRRSAKHAYVAEVAAFSPLLMPEPVQIRAPIDVEVGSPNPIEKQAIGQKKHPVKKRAEKKSVNCVTQK